MGMISIKKVKGFIRWEPYMADFKKEQFSKVRPPKRILFRKVPRDLSGLTFEQLAVLWSARDVEELFRLSGNVILGLPGWLVPHMPTLPMLGLVNMVTDQLQKIAGLFESLAEINPPTPQQIMAGCEGLKFGVFGMADAYALRMGIQDHDRVFRTPWIRIYQCMRNDAETLAYNRRLNEIMIQQSKR